MSPLCPPVCGFLLWRSFFALLFLRRSFLSSPFFLLVLEGAWIWSLSALVFCLYVCHLHYLVKVPVEELAGECRLALCLGLLEILTQHFCSCVDIKGLLTVQLVFSYPCLQQVLLPGTLLGMKTVVGPVSPRKALSISGIYFI